VNLAIAFHGNCAKLMLDDPSSIFKKHYPPLPELQTRYEGKGTLMPQGIQRKNSLLKI
jgi:hypothetical protein